MASTTSLLTVRRRASTAYSPKAMGIAYRVRHIPRLPTQPRRVPSAEKRNVNSLEAALVSVPIDMFNRPLASLC